MRNLPTPLFELIEADSQTKQFIAFCQSERETQSSEHFSFWTGNNDDEVAFASSWDGDDAFRCPLLDKLSLLISVVGLIHNLLLPERRVPATPEETCDQSFDGHAAGAELWACFHVACCCKRNKSATRRYSRRTVDTGRDQEEVPCDMSNRSWDERFGVLRLAVLARWCRSCVPGKRCREAIPCKLFANQEELRLEAASVVGRDDTENELKGPETPLPARNELCCGYVCLLLYFRSGPANPFLNAEIESLRNGFTVCSIDGERAVTTPLANLDFLPFAGREIFLDGRRDLPRLCVCDDLFDQHLPRNQELDGSLPFV